MRLSLSALHNAYLLFLSDKTNASYIWAPANVADVLRLLNSSPSDRILDIGCGSGELTATLVGAEVIGTDVSEVMIEQARAAASNNEKIKYYVVNGQDLFNGLRQAGVEGLFDKVFSNAALHWMKSDPAAVVRDVRQLLKPGGIFAAEYGGFRNLGGIVISFPTCNQVTEFGHFYTVGVRSAIHAALRRRGIDPITIDPFYFPTTKEYSAVLSQNGFHVNHIGLYCSLAYRVPSADLDCAELIPRVIPLPNGLRSWLQTFGNAYVEALGPGADGEVLWDEVEDECKIDYYNEDEGWSIFYTRLRFRATAI